MKKTRDYIDGRPVTSTFVARFFAKVKLGPGCWEWAGATTGNGYGQIARGRRETGRAVAHRASWELHQGPIPEGFEVHHRCGNTLCVNPDHLELESPPDTRAGEIDGGPASSTFARRFSAKVKLGPGCWEWAGFVTSDGYGQFSRGPRGAGMVRAHRASYELHHGPIPEGLEIHHVCENRRCVNPDHLQAIEKRENTLLSGSPPAVNTRKTHCSRGHPLSGENLRISRRKSGERRVCRACERMRERRRKHRRT